jgi:hypothetical protein
MLPRTWEFESYYGFACSYHVSDSKAYEAVNYGLMEMLNVLMIGISYDSFPSYIKLQHYWSNAAKQLFEEKSRSFKSSFVRCNTGYSVRMQVLVGYVPRHLSYT